MKRLFAWLRARWQALVDPFAGEPVMEVPRVPSRSELVAVPLQPIEDVLRTARGRIRVLEAEVEMWKCRAQKAEDLAGRRAASAAEYAIASTRDTELIEGLRRELLELRAELGEQTTRADAAEECVRELQKDPA